MNRREYGQMSLEARLRTRIAALEAENTALLEAVREGGQMSEGRKCRIWPAANLVTNVGQPCPGEVDAIAFTLPELAARDARVRKEALEEALRRFCGYCGDCETPDLGGCAMAYVCELRALAEKG